MTPLIIINLLIWLLLLVLMGTNKFPLGAVSLSIMLLLVLTGCITSPEALAKFSDNNVIIMGTMMITANAFGKTRAVKSIAKLLTKAGKGRWENAIRMFMVINFVLVFFLSGAIGRIAIVYPLAVAVCEENDISPSKVMFPLICCMLADQTGIPLGSGAVTYNKYNGYLAAAGYSFGDQFRMIDPFLCKAPLAIVMLLYFMFIGLKISPDHPSTAITGVNLKARKEDVLTSRQETIIYVTFILQCIGLVTASKTGIPQWIFTMGGALVVVMTKAIPVKQATDSIPFSIIFMYIGALAMGTALLNTGAGALIGKMVAGILGQHPSTIVLYLVFWLVTMFLTQFMNNGATSNLFIPVAILCAETIGCSALGLIMCIQMSSLVAWFTPMATAVMPIAMGAGGYSAKDLFKQGVLPGLLSTVAGVCWVAYLFPAWP